MPTSKACFQFPLVIHTTVKSLVKNVERNDSILEYVVVHQKVLQNEVDVYHIQLKKNNVPAKVQPTTGTTTEIPCCFSGL